MNTQDHLMQPPHPGFFGKNSNPLAALFANLAIFLLWLWLFRSVYSYLGTIFTRQEFRTNQIVLLVVLVLVGSQFHLRQMRLPLFDPPKLHLPGLAFALFGCLAFVAAEYWLDINTLSATLFGLATYGLLGLWMDGQSWRKGLPAALLLIGVLPFGEHIDTFIGYPLRLATARVVSQGLAASGIPNLGVDTILIFENGLSQVDNPCSGVKSLWTGGLFFLAATWIERRQINRRWLLAAVSFILILLAANLGRVALLVLVGQVAGWRLLAEMLHVPLGVIGFLVACIAAWGMLRWSGNRPGLDYRPDNHPPQPRWLAPALSAALVGFILISLLNVPRTQPAAAASLNLNFPPELALEEWPLDQIEMKWLSADGTVPLSAVRWHFTWRGLSGSFLMIYSDTWRAHHRPERCFTVYGLDVQESRLLMVGSDFPIRWLDLGATNTAISSFTASYWLQSDQRVTDDYSVRIWDDLAPQPEPWVLVTVLFNSPTDLTTADARSLLIALRQSVQAGLKLR